MSAQNEVKTEGQESLPVAAPVPVGGVVRDGQKFNVHPVARHFPMLSGEAKEAMLLSIKQIGVQKPLVLWRNEDGKEYLIDGRNRKGCWAELVAKGVTHADSGQELTLAYTYFAGTEKQVVDYIWSQGGVGRRLGSGQLAAIAVTVGHVRRILELKEQGIRPSADEQTEADFAASVAQMSGTNRQYIFDAMKLRKEAADLLDLVAKGEINIPEAKKRLANRKKGLPDICEDADGTKSDAETPVGPVEIFDGLKNLVSADHAPIFATRDEFKRVIRELRKLGADADGLSDGPGGAWLEKEAVTAGFKTLVKLLSNGMPYVVCPQCSGTGHDADNPRKQCTCCKRAKFLTKQQFNHLGADLQSAVPGSEAHSASEEESSADAVPEGSGAPASSPSVSSDNGVESSTVPSGTAPEGAPVEAAATEASAELEAAGV